MKTYLTFIGVMNALGVLLLLGAQAQWFAEGLLRGWTYVLAPGGAGTYGDFGRIWLWWATVGTGCFSLVNLVARRWPARFARGVVLMDVVAYSGFEVLAIAATLSPRFGPGIWVAHALWLGQGGWGLWVLLRSDPGRDGETVVT